MGISLSRLAELLIALTAIYKVSVTDLILAVVELLERDISRLAIEVRETLELVKEYLKKRSKE